MSDLDKFIRSCQKYWTSKGFDEDLQAEALLNLAIRLKNQGSSVILSSKLRGWCMADALRKKQNSEFSEWLSERDEEFREFTDHSTYDLDTTPKKKSNRDELNLLDISPQWWVDHLDHFPRRDWKFIQNLGIDGMSTAECAADLGLSKSWIDDKWIKLRLKTKEIYD